jgi:HD-GYP domain-containing protein (c-di-GMP phosphodiesterase class II)
MPGLEGPGTAKVQQLAQRMVLQLHMVLRTLRIHDPSNKALLIATENLKDTINTLWAALEGGVRLQVVDGVVYVNDHRIRMDPGVKDQVDHLQGELAKRELGGLAFSRPVDSAALRDFLVSFARPVEGDEELRAFRASLLEMKDLAVELLDPVHFKDAETEDQVRIDKRTFALQTYAKSIIAVREFIEGIRAGYEPDPRLRITRIVQDLVDIATERVNFLLRLSAIKSANDYPYNHAANTCVLSLVIGRALAIDRLAMVDLGTSAMLADVGFALLPPELIDREHELTPAERVEVRDAMIRQIRSLIGERQITDAMIRRVIVAYEHHLPYKDPDTGATGQTHIFSRIVQVADVFDALTTRRPWREGYSPDEALRILVQDAGTRFDPLVVKVFLNLMGMYPLGTAVRLSSGEIAIVYHNGTDPSMYGRPWVKVVLDARGQRVSRTVIRNLATTEGPEGRIESTARPAELRDLDSGMAIVV